MEKDFIDRYESDVRSYCRNFPAIFDTAQGSHITDLEGKTYLDFFAGAGALNYGHNNPRIKQKVIEYIMRDGVTHSLDMYTTAKYEFIKVFQNFLKERNMNYVLQFTGPTGTNAVEAALKLARKVTRRQNVIAFTGAFHGMTMGSLAATSDAASRTGAGQILPNVTFIPYPEGPFGSIDTVEYLTRILEDDHSGVDKPAAIILETVQAEGGIYLMPDVVLKKIADFCKVNDILFIIDDIQVGCSRTGTFFSFEKSGIVPDMIVLSKSISGMGFPMSLLLIKKEHDIWKPAEHNGTFRGNQVAFIAATEAIILNDSAFRDHVIQMEKFVSSQLLIFDGTTVKVRGKGLIFGIDFGEFEDKLITKKIQNTCFKNGLLIERCGRGDTVLKILPPLTITKKELEEGINIILAAIDSVISI